MAQVIQFPTASERDWRELEASFRGIFSDMPDGPATLEQCLPEIKDVWRRIYVEISIEHKVEIPGPLSAAQEQAIRAAISQAGELVAVHLKRERSQAMALLANSIFMKTFFQRHGGAA